MDFSGDDMWKMIHTQCFVWLDSEFLYTRQYTVDFEIFHICHVQVDSGSGGRLLSCVRVQRFFRALYTGTGPGVMSTGTAPVLRDIAVESHGRSTTTTTTRLNQVCCRVFLREAKRKSRGSRQPRLWTAKVPRVGGGSDGSGSSCAMNA